MKRPFSALVASASALEVPATEFKAKCLAMMQAVHDGKAAEIVVTKHGKPLAKIVPCGSVGQSLFGFAAGKLTIIGDIFATGEVWEAERPGR